MELDGLALRIEPKSTWADLVLAAEPLGQLHQIAEQFAVRHTVYVTWGFAEKANRVWR